jgi:hypothetical protein
VISTQENYQKRVDKDKNNPRRRVVLVEWVKRCIEEKRAFFHVPPTPPQRGRRPGT